jgi:hypothetical protein
VLAVSSTGRDAVDVSNPKQDAATARRERNFVGSGTGRLAGTPWPAFGGAQKDTKFELYEQMFRPRDPHRGPTIWLA